LYAWKNENDEIAAKEDTMANLMRSQPRELVSLREAMDRLFDESFLRPFGDGGFGGSGVPAVDVSETDNEIVVSANVPGFGPDNLHISIVGDVLQLSGQVQEETERKEATWHRRERRMGSFNRTIPLPARVVADDAQAEFENGILTLTLPKAQDARRRTITVKAGGQSRKGE
jgi:HSP20 family protein